MGDLPKFKMGDLSKNFSVKEFQCKCGCELKYPSPLLVALLQAIRDGAGWPLTIYSGWRCTSHNAAQHSKLLGKQGLHKGQAGDGIASAHTRGEAADIALVEKSKKETYALIQKLYEDGQLPMLKYCYMIKESKANVHVGVDDKPRNSIWGGEQ